MSLVPPPLPLRLSSRPLVGVAVALGAGVVSAERGWLAAPDAAALLAFAVVGAGAYALATRRRMVTVRALAAVGAALVGAFALGAIRHATVADLPPHHVAHAVAPVAARVPDVETPDPPVAVLTGRIANTPRDAASGVRFTLAADSARSAAGTRRVTGDVEVTLTRPRTMADDAPGPLFPALRLGDRVAVRGVVAAPPLRRNPAAMDYGRYLRRQGTHAVLRVESEADVVFLAPAARATDRLAGAVHRHVHRAFARTVPDESARAVLLGLVIAERAQIEAATLDAYRQTGLLHLLAVSGMHLVFVGLSLHALLRPVLGRLGVRYRRAEWLRAGLTLTLLVGYTIVTGGSVSAVRAVVMTGAVLLGRAAERRVDALNVLAAAALALLLWRPASLFDVGFQLSFGAVAALAALAPLMASWAPAAWTRPAAGRWLVGSTVASVAATLGTAPALLVHFGSLPLAGLVLNVPAIPLSGAALGGGLAAALADGVAPGAAGLFGAVASLATTAMTAVSLWGAEHLAGATVHGYLDSPWLVGAFVTSLVALALARRPVAGRRTALAAAALGVAGLGATIPDAAPRLDAVFLDVGQGDAAVLSLPGGGHVLVDAGNRTAWADEGARTVVPHLRRYGIRRLDAVILTHADADHIGGTAAVLRAVPVSRVVVNGLRSGSDLWRETLAVADSLGIPVQAVTSGDTLALDPAVHVRVLGPTTERVGAGDGNEASVVLHVQHGATRWLLSGDAEHAGEADLVARYGARLAADVVKVGHHGSRTSSTPAFVAAAGRPAFAVVSVAARNRYGLPDHEPLMRWQRTGADVIQTADAGAVWLRSDGRTVRRVDWRSDAGNR